jgi:hypothetical protein
MNAKEVIIKLNEIKKITDYLGGCDLDNINNKNSSEISQLCDQIIDDLKTIDFISSRTNPAEEN